MADKTSKSSKLPSKIGAEKKKPKSLFWMTTKFLLSQSYLIVVVSVFITFVPLRDFPFQAQSYIRPDYEKSLAAVLQQPTTAKLSYKLDDPKLTKKLFFGHVGPEAFTHDGQNSFYTGLADGRIVKFDDKFNKIELFARLSPNATAEKCDGQIHRSNECGRPLGLEIHQNRLYVVDAVDGLYSVDLKSKKSHLIPIKAYLASVLSDELSKKDFLFNDIKFDPIKPSLCYITVSTTRYQMGRLPYSLIEHENSGLLLALDLEHKNGSVLAKDLYFANGDEISTDKQYLYVAQTTAYSVSKLNLKQLRDSIYLNKGDLPKLESFLTDLPGEPDNLHVNNGKIYVSFAMIRLNGPIISDYLAAFPYVYIRNFVAKSAHVIAEMIHFVRYSFLENILNYKSNILEAIENQLYSGHLIYSVVRAKGGIAVYDEKTRKLIEVLASNEFGYLSHTFVHPKTKDLLIGSFKNDFITVVKHTN